MSQPLFKHQSKMSLKIEEKGSILVLFYFVKGANVFKDSGSGRWNMGQEVECRLANVFQWGLSGEVKERTNMLDEY